MRTITVTLGLFLTVLLANGQEVSLKGIYLGDVYNDSTGIWTTVAGHRGNLKVDCLKDKRVARISFHVTPENFNDEFDFMRSVEKNYIVELRRITHDRYFGIPIPSNEYRAKATKNGITYYYESSPRYKYFTITDDNLIMIWNKEQDSKRISKDF